MLGTILLNHNENIHQVEKEERERFLYSILDQMGVPIGDFWNGEVPLTVEQKIKLRDTLRVFEVQVIDDNAGALGIFVKNERVAEWFKPTYKLKRDLSQLDKRKQLYLEMTFEYYSMFEEISEDEEST